LNDDSCRSASRLLSDALDRSLTADEQHRVDQHLLTCPACRNCREHFRMLRWGAGRMGRSPFETSA